MADACSTLSNSSHAMQAMRKYARVLRTGDHDLEVLEALLGAARVLVQQQPLVQQHRVDGRHVRLPPQPPAHVQQRLCQIMLLCGKAKAWS
jgi:hypothetical protein